MKEAEMYIINPVKNRLPGGRFFKNIISDAKILYKNPNKINLCVFVSSLKAYFIIFDKKKIKIKNNKNIPRFLSGLRGWLRETAERTAWVFSVP